MTESAEAIALAATVRAGDEAAFNALAERHRRELLIHCYRMLGSLQDAEDAVQDTLLRAWKYRESLKAGASVRPWLYRVATNACLDAIGHDARRSALAAKSSAEARSVRKLGPPACPVWATRRGQSRWEGCRRADASGGMGMLAAETGDQLVAENQMAP